MPNFLVPPCSVEYGAIKWLYDNGVWALSPENAPKDALRVPTLQGTLGDGLEPLLQVWDSLRRQGEELEVKARNLPLDVAAKRAARSLQQEPSRKHFYLSVPWEYFANGDSREPAVFASVWYTAAGRYGVVFPKTSAHRQASAENKQGPHLTLSTLSEV